MLVTAIGYQTSVSTTYFDEPKRAFVNPLKVWIGLPNGKGTEIRDELGKGILIVKETPEELEELINTQLFRK